MSTKYPQGIINGTPPYAQGNFSGVWTLEQLAKNYYYYGDSIANSLRFRSSASAYLSRTFSSSANATKFTYSFWYKPGLATVNAYALEGYVSDSDRDSITFNNNNLNVGVQHGGSSVASLITTAVFRDPSAWYHFVIAYDSTQATASNRILVYVNGSQITAFSTASYPPQNQTTYLNSNVVHNIGRSGYSGGSLAATYMDGYLAEVNFIDGQALDPSYFGVTATATGVWSPKKYTGTYGTNGFHLNFSNGTSTTTLGYDSSGNSNNWTTNNISLTAGSTYDWMIDSPTSFAGSSYGVGNYAVLNAVNASTAVSITEANLSVAGTTSAYVSTQATFNLTSGKWYFEMTKATSLQYVDGLGLVVAGYSRTSSTPGDTGSYTITDANPSQVVTKSNGGSSVIVSTTNWANNDIIQCAYDASTGYIWFGRNGSWYPATSGGTVGDPSAGTNPTITAVSGLTPAVITYGSTNKINFGQRPFSYTPPSGYKSLCTQNLPTPTVPNGANYFAATTYTGTGATQSISNAVNGVIFQPDFVWIKSRSAATDHKLTDIVRGVTKALISDSTAAETTDTNGLTAFNSNGFTLGSDTVYNNTSATYIGWQWKANGAAVTNTAGSITSQVSANTTAGFSVVTYTGGQAANFTVGHGLGVQPSFVITKSRSSASNWGVYYTNNGVNTNWMVLNTTAAQGANNGSLAGGAFMVLNSSTMQIDLNAYANGGSSMVAYCFAAIAGYSAFGSYTGNGSADGPFVYCGFRPRFVLFKRSDSGAYDWVILDTSRDTYNAAYLRLLPNTSVAEDTSVNPVLDIVSNGFKIRTSNNVANTSGSTYIYAAFAENPFNYSLAR